MSKSAVMDYVNECVGREGEECMDYLFSQRSVWWEGRVRSIPWIMCEAGNGPPPSEASMPIRECQTPMCCNKYHYHWGSKTEAAFHRMSLRERGGAKNPNAKLSWDAVSEIRNSGLEAGPIEIPEFGENGEIIKRVVIGVSSEIASKRMAMAEKYGVTVQTIYRVLMGHIWKEEDRPESQGDEF